MKIKTTQVFLPLKRYSQGPTDDLCGVKCLESVYEFFDSPKTTNYFIRELGLADEMTFMPQILRLLAKDGYNVLNNISNVQIFDLTWKGFSNIKLIEKLHDRYQQVTDSTWKRLITEYILYLTEGNKITQDIISENLLRFHLQKNRLLIAFVDNVIFHQRGRRFWDETNNTYDPDDIKGGSDGHSVVINGWSAKKGVHIVDPSEIQEYGIDGCYWIDPAVLIAGIYSHSGEMGVVWK